MKQCISGYARVVNEPLTGWAEANGSLMGEAEANEDMAGAAACMTGLSGVAMAVRGLKGMCSIVCSLNRTPFLKVSPDVVWLTYEEISSGEFDVISNVNWTIE